jgi:hypothetical protein
VNILEDGVDEEEVEGAEEEKEAQVGEEEGEMICLLRLFVLLFIAISLL